MKVLIKVGNKGDESQNNVSHYRFILSSIWFLFVIRR